MRFNDGTERVIDFEEKLWGPVFEPLKADPEPGTIVWPDEADMDPDVLHGSDQPA